MLCKKIYNLGDKLEDKVRGFLSHYPLVYAFIGGVGTIVFWRGVWVTIDYILECFYSRTNVLFVHGLMWWDGPLSVIIGTVILLLTGLFVSGFIGNEIIISGLKGEKRVVEKSVKEIKEDVGIGVEILNEIKEINQRLKKLEEKK